jgi:hypothetical protein
LSGGDDLGPFSQVFGTEQLTADRAGEEVLVSVGLEEGGENAEGAARVERDGGLAMGCWDSALWAMDSVYKVYGGVREPSGR